MDHISYLDELKLLSFLDLGLLLMERNLESDVRTPLGVEAHQFLQGGGFDQIEAHLPPEGARLPVLG